MCQLAAAPHVVSLNPHPQDVTDTVFWREFGALMADQPLILIGWHFQALTPVLLVRASGAGAAWAASRQPAQTFCAAATVGGPLCSGDSRHGCRTPPTHATIPDPVDADPLLRQRHSCAARLQTRAGGAAQRPQ